MKYKKYNIPLGIGIALIFIGTLFKIQRWPFGLEITLFGVAVILTFYILRFLSKKEKQLIDLTALALVVGWCVHIVMRLFKIPYAKETSFSLLTLGGVYLVLYILKFLRKSEKIKTNESKVSKTLFVLATVFIVVGVFFKIQHLSGSSILNITGFTLAGLWFISQIKLGKK